MIVPVARVNERDLISKGKLPPESPVTQTAIQAARRRQHLRYGTEIHNSELPSKQIAEVTKLTTGAKKLLDDAAGRLQLSARSYFKIIKIARTIADLSESDTIESSHIAEALQYRGNSLPR